MNSRRTVILLIAIVVSAVSAFGLSQYIKGLEDDVYSGAALGQMWVVAIEIPKGTPAEQAIGQGMIVPRDLPVEFIPQTAIKNPGEELNNLVAVVDLPVAHNLVAGNFVAPNVVSTGITDRLEERDMVTLTFTVDQVAGAGGFIQPGDFVNLLAVRPYVWPEKEEEAAAGEDGGGNLGGSTKDEGLPDFGFSFYVNPLPESAEESNYLNSARYVYQKAEVLAVGNALPLDLGESEIDDPAAVLNTGLITLAVPPDAVQRVIAVGMENIYLSLVPPSYEPIPLLPIDISEWVFPGEDERLTPYFATEETEDAPAE